MKKKLRLLLVMYTIGILCGYSQTTLNDRDMNMTEKETRNIVTEFYEYTSKRDVAGVMQMISEDITWNLPGNKVLAPWLGERKGKTQVQVFFSLLEKHTKSREFRIDKLLVEGNNAVAVGYLSSEMLATNQVFDSFFMAYFTVENQKIINYLFVEDSWKLVEILSERE